MEMKISTADQSYVPAHLAIEAMRDNGYKNTAYAVAELIDNSIQAEATYVQLLCAEKEYQLSSRKTKRLEQIAILDNGTGMDESVLRMALQFGNGTRLKRDQRTGIGRFGMGLPASSISQCKRVDVWSWQNGVDNAFHVYLDIEEIKQKKTNEIPEPTQKPVPSVWREIGRNFGQSGTLVVWTDLDRMMWNKGQTLAKHSELLIGRMYRKFLDKQMLNIELKVFDIENLSDVTLKQSALPNDPGYLMSKTSCPEPFHDTPMFEPFGGEHFEKKYEISFQGEIHELFVRLSVAKDDARNAENAGSKHYGKHAKENVGISIVRAGRELELDQSLVIQYEPRERWWGIEVEFPPSLDELMGVTNNKQSARNFSDVLGMVEEIKKMQTDGKTILEIQEELIEEGDPRAPLIIVCDFIHKQISNMRKLIVQQRSGTRTSQRHTNIDVEKKATSHTDRRKEMGFEGESDRDEEKPPEARVEAITKGLVESGVDEKNAIEVATSTITHNLKYSFTDTPFEGDAFFTVRPCGGAINILLNTRHPAYEHLVEVLDATVEDNTEEGLKERLNKASEGLKLLLAAWARYEDETPDGTRRDYIQDVRQSWGKFARDFLRSNE